jgi:hypothetical protein
VVAQPVCGDKPLIRVIINKPSDDVLAGINASEPIIRIKWANLERVAEGGTKSHCPTCGRGALLVRRDADTLKLLPEDRCILCAQRVVYTDIPNDQMA